MKESDQIPQIEEEVVTPPPPLEEKVEAEEYEPDENVRLPVGIPVDGQRYRNVLIEEMSGIDDHLVSSKKSGNNGAKAMTLVLSRCMQAVEGYLEQKKDPEKMFDRNIPRIMTQPDRDFLITRIHMLAERDEGIMAGECPRCQRVWEEPVKLSKLPVVEWPDDKPLEIEFELEKGSLEIVKGQRVYHKKGVLRFPTGKEQELVAQLSTVAEATDSMLAACITKLGTLENVDTEVVKRFKTRDRKKLMTIIQRELPGIRQWKSVKCQCGREFDIVLDLAAFFEGRRSKTIKY